MYNCKQDIAKFLHSLAAKPRTELDTFLPPNRSLPLSNTPYVATRICLLKKHSTIQTNNFRSQQLAIKTEVIPLTMFPLNENQDQYKEIQPYMHLLE